MSGINRSVVFGAGDEVTLHLGDDSAECAVEVDGLPSVVLRGGDSISVVMREKSAQVVRLAPGRHAATGRVKLSLLDLPLRRDQLLDLVPEQSRDNRPDD